MERTRRYSRISSTVRFLHLMEAALRMVRMALAVRPCLPITLPRSSLVYEKLTLDTHFFKQF